jgi:flagellar hook-length control protein FliK
MARYAVGLEDALETVRMSVQAAAAGGASMARIQLSPASLGTVRIQLQQTSDGLIARVVADHPAAAQVLQQGGDELRRALEGSGTTLLGLDIGASGQQAGHGPGRGAPTPGAQTQSASEPDSPEGSASTEPPQTVALPNGTLIDIFA